MKQSRESLAKLVNAKDSDELVLVENASAAVNAILRSIKWNKGDKVLIFQRAYPMTINTLEYLKQREGFYQKALFVQVCKALTCLSCLHLIIL